MIHGLVRLIRKYYDPKVSVLVRMDAGFFDGSNFEFFEKLGVYYVCGGRLDERGVR